MDRDRWNATGWAFVLVGVLVLVASVGVFGGYGEAWPHSYYAAVIRIQEIFVVVPMALLSLGVLIASCSSPDARAPRRGALEGSPTSPSPPPAP